MMRYNIETLPTRTTKGGEEVDAFSPRSRRSLRWARGEVRTIKSRAQRRDRHQVREALRVERY